MHINAILISILKYWFIVELFEKWRSGLPPLPVGRSIWASHLGNLATQLGVSPHVKAPNPDPTQGGGGGLDSPLAGFPRHTKNWFFVLFSLIT
jgi:hypothetical protein